VIRASGVCVRLASDRGRLAWVLDGIDVTLERGRVVAIVGRNAAGKTTLLRTLAGVLEPSEGSVHWDGRDAATWSTRARAERIAYVAQRPSLSARFTVAETIALGRYALPTRPERVLDAIERFGLGAIADRLYHELSIGQQHRVSLARAWAQIESTGALLLDEPFAATDLAETDRSAKLVRQHAARGGLTVVVLHDLSLAARLADEVILLDGGRVAASGAVREVLTVEFLAQHFGVPFRLDLDGIPEPVIAARGIV
jgi:iron complex transport system ATP-binding protein